jgi:hypothetical protein
MKEFECYDRLDEDDPPLCLSCGQAMDWDGPPVSQLSVCQSCWSAIGAAGRIWLQLAVLSVEDGGIGLRDLLEESRRELRTTRSILDPGPN